MSAADADINRRAWNSKSDDYHRRHRRQLDANDAGWGVWQIPERELRILGDVRGKHLVELGCGGGHWAVWLARTGANVTAVDLSERQLHHARELARSHDVPVRFLQADGERLPIGNESVDVVMSDHGATTFANPELLVPAVARALVPGGLFAFNHMTPLLEICWDGDHAREGPTLRRDYFEMGRLEWDDEITYQLTYGDWIRLIRRSGFEVEDLVELRPPDGARTTFGAYVSYEWATRWPAEQIWVLRKR